MAKRARAVAVKQRRQIVSMRDRAWGEFSLWDVVCMVGTCLVCFCKLVFWCFAKCLGVEALWKGPKLRWYLKSIKYGKNEKPQPFGLSKK